MATKDFTILADRTSDKKKTSILFKSTKNPTNVYPHFSASENIPSTCEILWFPLDANGNRTGEGEYPRQIRYVRGAKSIFVDEMSDIEVEKKAEKIVMKIGFITIPTRDKNLLNYLRYCGYNDANNDTRINSGVLFAEQDYEKEATIQVAREKQLIEAQNFVYTAPIDEIRAFAEVLCKTKADIDGVRLRGDDEIRRSLIPIAQTKPEIFVDGLKSQSLKNKVFITRAVQKGIIKIDDEQRRLTWAKGGEQIIESAIGLNVMDHFAEYADKSPENIKTLDAIKEMLSSSNSEVATSAPQLTWQESLIEEAINDEIITQSGGNWFMISGEEGEDPVFKVQGKKKLIKAITENKDNLMGLIAERR